MDRSLFSQTGLMMRFAPTDERTYAENYTVDVGFVEVDVGEMIEKGIQYTIDMMNKGVKELISSFNNYIVGLPAPGEATDPTTWAEGDGRWTAVYAVYGIMSALAVALLTPSFMVATDTIDRQKRRAYFTELGKAAFFIVLGIPITAFCLHLGHSVTVAVAPDGLEFLASLENLSNLGVGIIFGSILIYAKGTLVAIGILCTMLIRLLVYLSVAFWPIFWAFRVQPQKTIKGYGHMGIALFPLLILLRFTQAGILRFLFELPYGSGEGALFKLVATTGGLAICLIGLPYFATVKLLPGTSMLLESTRRRGAPKEEDTSKHDRSTSNTQNTHYSGKYYGPKSENPDPKQSNRQSPHQYRNYAAGRGPRSKHPNATQRGSTSGNEPKSNTSRARSRSSKSDAGSES